MCLSVLKLTPATNTFSSKWKYEKLAVVVHVHSYCFAPQTFCLVTFSLALPSCFA